MRAHLLKKNQKQKEKQKQKKTFRLPWQPIVVVLIHLTEVEMISSAVTK